MAFKNCKKKYQLDKKEAEAVLQDILAANGQDDVVRRSHSAFCRKTGARRWLWIPIVGILIAVLSLIGIFFWPQ